MAHLQSWLLWSGRSARDLAFCRRRVTHSINYTKRFKGGQVYSAHSSLEFFLHGEGDIVPGLGVTACALTSQVQSPILDKPIKKPH